MLRRNRDKGISIVELVASMAFGLPLLLAILYAVLEANYYFSICTQMELAARRACAKAAATYAASGGLMTYDPSLDSALNIPHFVNSTAGQFVTTWSVKSNGGTPPYTVTVTCFYPSAGNAGAGLPPFPNPDILGMGPTLSSVVTIHATATFPVEPEK